MAVLDQNFLNVYQQVETIENTYEPIPAGDYTLQVTEVGIKESRSGGQYIHVVFEVLGPAYKGRKIFQNFTIQHNNSDAVRIGISQVKALATAAGVDSLRDTDQLINTTVNARVVVDKNKNPDYPDNNRAIRFQPAGALPPQAAAPSGGSFSEAFAKPAGSETKAAGASPWGF